MGLGVMNLQAAACAGDKVSYHWIKDQLKSIAETETQALEKGLLRTAQSNDYPAWAMAKVRCAAIVAEDEGLYRAIEKPLTLSIDGAHKANAKAEYVLSVLDNQLAIYTAHTRLLLTRDHGDRKRNCEKLRPF